MQEQERAYSLDADNLMEGHPQRAMLAAAAEEQAKKARMTALIRDMQTQVEARASRRTQAQV